ncbi:sulfotransferase [uncultured Jannaschia sp.]|uniref:sulfotransferase family protein n=1 Tax=uncultured Jannaschia sp. TaxID=293347 RepID=UPI002636AF69|nr:sulfotransferase [uncultured Jannaschia sp.]
MRSRDPDRWAFATGCYNSGTTIIARILAAHPGISALPIEGVNLTDAFPDLEAGGWQRMWHRNDVIAAAFSPDPAELARTAIRDWSPWCAPGTTVMLEKSIIHTRWMPLLDRAFPDARFIFILRNGLCACEGILRRARPSGRAATELGSDAYAPEEAARQWIASNAPLLGDAPAPSRMLVVRYEAFVADPVRELRRILDHLDLDASVVGMTTSGLVRMGKLEFEVVDQNPASLARLATDTRERLETALSPALAALGYGGSGP